MSDDIKKILRQLSIDQLIKLAKLKKAKDTVLKKTKPQLVDFLSHLVTRREIDELLAKHGRTGDKAVIDGMVFERKVLKIFDRKGWKCHLNNVDIPHMEFDIVGYQRINGFLGAYTDFWLIAECKNKPRVSMTDYSKFYVKYLHFMKQKKETPKYCFGYMITSGYFDPEVKKMAKQHGIRIIPSLR